ncbi:hypothetical protein LK09_00325 [Microbacterium mangrovi]|uniref:PrpF, AcnD-accessory n=1 Tax=Microbacterium mangrovi TaxID=1348253 RepID=A0A0B2ADG3_9MICO|nr:PrpF domain-containing protein [Microbacterium mangrovi]KHK99827.1 hypothetical protein LK09_00325 [Microbacterium mangrovi]
MRVPATLMRGGTSKCWLFDRSDVPGDRRLLSELLIDLFGADDPHQLDGVGGGTSVTSKAAVVSRSTSGDADVDYLFAQVGIGAHTVEWGSNCGNCATAVALWAVERYRLPARPDGTVPVRMRNINTGSLVVAVVGTSESAPTRVPGVRGVGTPVDLTFLAPAGSTTGSLWPTGKRIEAMSTSGVTVDATLADAGAPVALIPAADLGLPDAASEHELRDAVPLLRRIRARAAVRMGLAPSEDAALDAVPKVGVVGRAVDYVDTLGQTVRADEYDVSVRMLSMNAPHPTIGLTAAVAVAVVASEPGTVLEHVGVPSALSRVRIGTAGGVLACEIHRSPATLRVELRRAARRIADSQILTGEPVPA